MNLHRTSHTVYLSYCATLTTFFAYCLYEIPWALGSMFTYWPILPFLSFGHASLTSHRPGELPAADNEIRPRVTTTESSSASTCFAVVIGIDNYLHQPHLAGATYDADKISDFLIMDLGTPPSHIINLRNSEATRENIIQAFRKLQDNPQIQPGSPILIYFAGHGGIAYTSETGRERRRATTKVQVIFPYDYCEDYGEGKANCIPDKTIGKLLNELSTAKGDNIETVIFDSCHSASGSRVSIPEGDRRVRCANVKLDIPVDIDDDIRLPVSAAAASTTRNISSPFCTHQMSHIHLAACGSNEYAWEESGRGKFTTALLKAIRAQGVNNVTYHNLIVGLPHLPQQTPHCYGAYKSRILFNGRVPSQKIAYIPVIYDPASRATLTLQAGTASGVSNESVWELHTRPTLGHEESIGTVIAGPPGVSRTGLRTKEKDDAFWEQCGSGTAYDGGRVKLYARLLESGPESKLKVWFSPEAKQVIFSGVGSRTSGSCSRINHEFNYVMHPVQDSADMIVNIYKPTETSPSSTTIPSSGTVAGPEVEFRLHNPTVQKYGVTALARHVPARQADVENVLFAAARWHWYLGQSNPDYTSNPVEMEMFKIAERSKDASGVYSDTQRRQIPKDKRINLKIDRTGVVEFDVHEKDLYGIRLKSGVDRPLYVRMFYFDTTTFCIVSQFGHTGASGREDPDLGSLGNLVIGDDEDGGTPLPFNLDAGEVLDVGFLKVFWSTDPLELESVEQGSAFEMQAGSQSRKVTVVRRGFQKSDWGATTLVLVQRKPPSEDA